MYVLYKYIYIYGCLFFKCIYALVECQQIVSGNEDEVDQVLNQARGSMSDVLSLDAVPDFEDDEEAWKEYDAARTCPLVPCVCNYDTCVPSFSWQFSGVMHLEPIKN